MQNVIKNISCVQILMFDNAAQCTQAIFRADIRYIHLWISLWILNIFFKYIRSSTIVEGSEESNKKISLKWIMGCLIINYEQMFFEIVLWIWKQIVLGQW